MKKKEPLVSVIVPTYNREKSIERTINSVTNQTYKNWELIVVDDGSKDNTSILMKKYTKDKRIKYCRYSPNKGVGHARNVGIENAKGDYIAFLDSDDEFSINKIEIQLKEMLKHKVNFSITNFVIKKEDKITNNGLNVGKSYIMSKKELILNRGPLLSMIVNKEILDKNHFFDEFLPSSNDYDFVLKFLSKTKILFVADKLLIVHKELEGNRISSNYEKKIEGYRTLLERTEKGYYNFNKSDNRLFINKLNLQLGLFYILQKKYKEGRHYLFQELSSMKMSNKKLKYFFLNYISYSPFLLNIGLKIAKKMWEWGIIKTE